MIVACGGGGEDLEIDRSETVLSRPAPVTVNPPAPAVASALLQGPEESELRGLVTFIQESNGVRVVTEVSDAEPGSYALWVHQQGLCEEPEFESAGEAFDPLGVQSSATFGVRRQAGGDLGSIEVGADGRGRKEALTRWITVTDGLHAVQGRSVLLHAVSAAGVAACGVIQLQLEEETTGDAGGVSS